MKIFLSLTFLLLNINSVFAQMDSLSLNGIWKMNGYGKIIEISDSEVSTYDLTNISCVLNYKIKRDEIRQLGKFKLLNSDSLNIKLGITDYYLHRIKDLPKQILTSDSIQLKNLRFNFDVFWHTLNENYAFFKERKLNWENVYEDYSDKIDGLKSEKELYEIFRKITDKLNDEHTTVRASEEIMEAYEKSLDTLEESSSSIELSIEELEQNILNKYVENPISYGKSLHGNGLLNYGITPNNVGYLQINNMIFFGDYKISNTLTGYDFLFAYLEESNKNQNYQEDEIKGIKICMDSIIDKFENTDAIILDLRFNYGGYDVVSLEILKHFIDRKAKVFSKTAKTQMGYTKPQSYSITPTDKTYTKPVFFLTSHQTSSAPESLIIASMPFKNIKVLGSKTMGITSDVLEKKLPNGWDLYLSNEILVNYKGECFEGVGVPPDIKINYPEEEDLFIQYLSKKLKDGDEAIEKVFELLKVK